MLGEGVSIKRLKYRIHATNVRAPLSFMQDLGRLLRLFPEDAPEPVETLIPAHAKHIQLALDALNEIAHVVSDIQPENSVEENNAIGSGEENQESLPSNFEPLASTRELGAQIVDGEEISDRFTSVAEWAVANKEIWRHRGKTPAHRSANATDANQDYLNYYAKNMKWHSRGQLPIQMSLKQTFL